MDISRTWAKYACCVDWGTFWGTQIWNSRFCRRKSLGSSGAHIRLQSSHGLPDDFYLVEANRGIIHKAEVAWRTTTGMGLRILGPIEDASARAALLRKFKRNAY